MRILDSVNNSVIWLISENEISKKNIIKELKKKDKNFFEWFPDGKLNAAMNCLEKKSKNKIAIYQIDKNIHFPHYCIEYWCQVF